MRDDLDLPIDGEPESSPRPKARRKVIIRKKPVKKTVSSRRHTAVYSMEDEDAEEIVRPSFHERPRISIDAATNVPRKVNLYRRLAMTFLGATVVVVGIIAFFTFQQANIKVAQDAIPVAASFSAEISESSTTSTLNFRGLVVAVTTSTESLYRPSTTIDKPGKAHGKLTVRNNGGSPQSLVATTRFLSEGGVLFRAVNAVSIPVNSSATVEVAADKPGASGDIPAGKFTIPGLNAAQQKLVYGESDKPMTGGSGKVGVVTQGDIDKAQEDARKTLLEIGQRELTSVKVPNGDDVLYATVNIKAVSTAKVGDEVSEFKVVTSGTMAYVAYPKNALFAAADHEVQTKAPTSYHKIIFVNDAPAISLQSIDVVKKSAILQIYREGHAVLDARSAALQPSMFMGQSRAQILEQIKSIKGVTNVEVTFMPPWIDRAPKVPARIMVEINQNK